MLNELVISFEIKNTHPKRNSLMQLILTLTQIEMSFLKDLYAADIHRLTKQRHGISEQHTEMVYCLHCPKSKG